MVFDQSSLDVMVFIDFSCLRKCSDRFLNRPEVSVYQIFAIVRWKKKNTGQSICQIQFKVVNDFHTSMSSDPMAFYSKRIVSLMVVLCYC